MQKRVMSQRPREDGVFRRELQECHQALLRSWERRSRVDDLKNNFRDFPGGTAVKNLPANVGDTGSSPGLGRSHMLWSN